LSECRASSGCGLLRTPGLDGDMADTEPERVAVVEAALGRGLLGLRVLHLLSLRVEVLGAVGLLGSAVLALVLDVLVVDGHSLLDLAAEGLVVASTMRTLVSYHQVRWRAARLTG